MKVTAQATRSGKWWAVEVPEIPGLFTQARRLDQVVEAVADAASMLGHPQVEVEIVPQLSAGDLAAIETAKARRSQLRAAEAGGRLPSTAPRPPSETRRERLDNPSRLEVSRGVDLSL